MNLSFDQDFFEESPLLMSPLIFEDDILPSEINMLDLNVSWPSFNNNEDISDDVNNQNENIIINGDNEIKKEEILLNENQIKPMKKRGRKRIQRVCFFFGLF